MTVARSSHEIAAYLRRQIEGGALCPGEQLPTGAELRDRHGVARQTVYAAIKILRDEGLIFTRPGVGCYVRDRSTRVRLVRLPVSASVPTERTSLLQSFTAADAEEWLADVTTHRTITTAGADLAAELGIDESDEVFLRVRSMSDEGMVVALVTSCFPRSITLGTKIEETDTGDGGACARLLELGFGVTRHIERVTSGVANADESAQLRLGPPIPLVLRIRRVTVDRSGRVLGAINITAPVHY